jgi:hypothetical protein
MDLLETKLSTLRLSLSRSLDGSASPEDVEQLNALLLEDSQIRRYYLEYIQVHINLRRLHGKDASALKTGPEESFDSRLWEELARNEMTAETIKIEPSREEIDSQTDTPLPVRPSARINKFSIYTLLTAAAALLLMFAYIHFYPAKPPVVAYIADILNGQWDTSTPLQSGDDIRTEHYSLRAGFVKLAYDSGASVVIQAPAEFTPLSANKMLLHKGKAFAHVPGNAIGFTIDTPASSIVDLGTEFGVDILSDGSNEIHVFEGKVNLIAGSNTQSKASEIVTRRQARKINAGNAAIEPAEFKEFLFAQKISSKENRVVYGCPVSLASFVAGGDGRTPGDQPTGIDPATGHIHQTVEEKFGRTGSGTYCTVPDLDFVDGVFVPNGPCVVSSAGHTFEGFPATTGTFWCDITTSPVFNYTATNDNGEVLYRQQFIATLDTAAEGKTDSEKRVILMHTNSGITFNLNKIRKAFKNAEIVGFRADCGVTKNAMVKMRHDIWVLLDGQQVFHYPQPAYNDTAQTIYIPIHPEQSYLTLATTDGGDNTSYDWCLFENAVLELVPRGL